MARLFVPSVIQVSTKTAADGTVLVDAITLSGGLYLFGPDQGRLDGRLALTDDEQATVLAVVQAAASRHWEALASAYAATVDAPDAHEVVVPAPAP